MGDFDTDRTILFASKAKQADIISLFRAVDEDIADGVAFAVKGPGEGVRANA
jgi:hypothetical protein